MDAAHVASPPVGAVHVLPQVPQFSGFVATFTQAPSQGVRLVAHDVRHPVAVQSSVAPQTVVQPPQWLESAARLTQLPLQFV
jgi:hypothetical protein